MKKKGYVTTESEALQIAKRHEYAMARKNWQEMWEDIALFSMPGKADFIAERSQGDSSRLYKMFDSTAAVANHTLASHMHSALTNPALPWFDIKFRNPALEKNQPAQIWLEDCVNRMQDAINDSNFVAVINEVYQDLVAFGTAPMHSGFTLDGEEFQLVFKTMPLATMALFEDIHGRVNAVMFEIKLRAEQFDEMFPGHQLADVTKLVEKEPDKEIKVLHAVLPNAKYDKNKPLEPEKRKYKGVYIYGTEGGKRIVKEEFHYEFPYQVPRWSKMTIEPYGYGPGLLALADVRTLNEAKRLELAAYEKAIDPPITMMANGVVGDVDTGAGGVTTIRDANAIGSLRDQSNWQALQIKAEELRKSIQSIYLIDQLILPERPNATATEVQIRHSMMMRVLGPTGGRLNAELLSLLVVRIFNIMHRNSQFEVMPEELRDEPLDILYTGPLAKAQLSEDAVAVERLLGTLSNMAAIDPSVLKTVDFVAAANLLADTYGVPEHITRTVDQVEQMNRAEEESENAQLKQYIQQLEQERSAKAPEQAQLQAV